jgi:hypothetical protein
MEDICPVCGRPDPGGMVVQSLYWLRGMLTDAIRYLDGRYVLVDHERLRSEARERLENRPEGP